jgi:histidine triad (HIT) family protein
MVSSAGNERGGRLVAKSAEEAAAEQTCRFCAVARKEVAAPIVFEDAISLAFLDNRPLFPGHCLLIPKLHYEALADLPAELLAPFFANVQRLAGAVERGMQAEGTFVAINNRISQSVPHLHVHIVPRRRKDALRGFFWPRQKYASEAAAEQARAAVEAALGRARGPSR